MSLSYVILVIGGIGLFATELLIRRRRRMKVDMHEIGVSLGVGVLAYLSAGVGALGVAALGWWAAHHLAPWHLPWRNPLTWFAYVLLDDFVAFWVHRANHRYRFLWSSHLVHHSARDITMANAARLSPVEGFTQPLMNIWAPLLGFPVVMYAPLTVISLLWLEFQHTRVVDRMGPFEYVLNTPSNHRVHHGKNPAYIDCNFGSWTMLWDRLFRTYVPETEPVVFGVTDRFDQDHVLSAAAGGYPVLLRDMRSVRGWKARLRVALARPGTSSAIDRPPVAVAAAAATS